MKQTKGVKSQQSLETWERVESNSLPTLVVAMPMHACMYVWLFFTGPCYLLQLTTSNSHFNTRLEGFYIDFILLGGGS